MGPGDPLCGVARSVEGLVGAPRLFRGAWRDGRFHDIEDMRDGSGAVANVGRGCACELTDLVSAEIDQWRMLVDEGTLPQP
jgi:hypothetical protein